MKDYYEALDDVTESIKVVAEVLKQSTDNLYKTFSELQDSILKCFGDKRIVHLAFRAKKQRIRKKNRNKLLKEFWRILMVNCYS